MNKDGDYSFVLLLRSSIPVTFTANAVSNRSGGLGSKPRMPLRKPKVSTTQTYYCYSCKADVPFLCGPGDSKRCPTCKSDFVEDKETATTHLKSEKEIKTQKELKLLKERSAVQHAR